MTELYLYRTDGYGTTLVRVSSYWLQQVNRGEYSPESLAQHLTNTNGHNIRYEAAEIEEIRCKF